MSEQRKISDLYFEQVRETNEQIKELKLERDNAEASYDRMCKVAGDTHVELDKAQERIKELEEILDREYDKNGEANEL